MKRREAELAELEPGGGTADAASRRLDEPSAPERDAERFSIADDVGTFRSATVVIVII